MNAHFSEMLSALSAEGADHLVVGAYALAAHGHPRATGDIDIWVRPTPENAAKVMRALRRFGAPMAGLAERDLATPGAGFQVGVVPQRIDLLTSIDGVGFDEAWPRRETREVDGVRVPVIGREDLLRNKRAAGRAQDLADVESLEGRAG